MERADRVQDLQEPQPEKYGNYFTSPKKLDFIHSGCTLLDCALGGGWPLGRISNVVGNRSSGKSLLGIEACANFARQYPNGAIYYRDTEAVFDESYAQALGMPLDRVDFGTEEFFTVEDLFEDLEKALKTHPKNTPGLYIIDSLDALSDRDELEREIDKGTYGAQKAKILSQLFRRMVQRLSDSRFHVMVVSQVRDKLDAGLFGKKTTKSGGRALDFYCSQIVQLSHLKTLTKERGKVERAVGIKVGAKLEKNKISLPFRECTFEIFFHQGIDNLSASLAWLHEVGKEQEILGKSAKEYNAEMDKLDDKEYWQRVKELDVKVTNLWFDIEKRFIPERRKYS